MSPGDVQFIDGKTKDRLGPGRHDDFRSADLEVVVLSTAPYLPRKMSAPAHL